MSDTLDLDNLLRELGCDTPEALARGRQLLLEAGLTRPGKTGIAAAKRETVEAVLATVDLVCPNPDCQRQAGRSGRELLTVSAASCSVCGGSDLARAVATMIDALAGAGLRRLLILGGMPVQHRQLEDLLRGSAVETRCIDGSKGAHTMATARSHLEWAELTVLWASTPLSHKVSQSYTTPDQRQRCPQITVARRSLTALCDEVTRHARRRGDGGS